MAQFESKTARQVSSASLSLDVSGPTLDRATVSKGEIEALRTGLRSIEPPNGARNMRPEKLLVAQALTTDIEAAREALERAYRISPSAAASPVGQGLQSIGAQARVMPGLGLLITYAEITKQYDNARNGGKPFVQRVDEKVYNDTMAPVRDLAKADLSSLIGTPEQRKSLFMATELAGGHLNASLKDGDLILDDGSGGRILPNGNIVFPVGVAQQTSSTPSAPQSSSPAGNNSSTSPTMPSPSIPAPITIPTVPKIPVDPRALQHPDTVLRETPLTNDNIPPAKPPPTWAGNTQAQTAANLRELQREQQANGVAADPLGISKPSSRPGMDFRPVGEEIKKLGDAINAANNRPPVKGPGLDDDRFRLPPMPRITSPEGAQVPVAPTRTMDVLALPSSSQALKAGNPEVVLSSLNVYDKIKESFRSQEPPPLVEIGANAVSKLMANAPKGVENLNLPNNTGLTEQQEKILKALAAQAVSSPYINASLNIGISTAKDGTKVAELLNKDCQSTGIQILPDGSMRLPSRAGIGIGGEIKVGQVLNAAITLPPNLIPQKQKEEPTEAPPLVSPVRPSTEDGSKVFTPSEAPIPQAPPTPQERPTTTTLEPSNPAPAAPLEKPAVRPNEVQEPGTEVKPPPNEIDTRLGQDAAPISPKINEVPLQTGSIVDIPRADEVTPPQPTSSRPGEAVASREPPKPGRGETWWSDRFQKELADLGFDKDGNPLSDSSQDDRTTSNNNNDGRGGGGFLGWLFKDTPSGGSSQEPASPATSGRNPGSLGYGSSAEDYARNLTREELEKAERQFGSNPTVDAGGRSFTASKDKIREALRIQQEQEAGGNSDPWAREPPYIGPNTKPTKPERSPIDKERPDGSTIDNLLSRNRNNVTDPGSQRTYIPVGNGLGVLEMSQNDLDRLRETNRELRARGLHDMALDIKDYKVLPGGKVQILTDHRPGKTVRESQNDMTSKQLEQLDEKLDELEDRCRKRGYIPNDMYNMGNIKYETDRAGNITKVYLIDPGMAKAAGAEERLKESEADMFAKLRQRVEHNERMRERYGNDWKPPGYGASGNTINPGQSLNDELNREARKQEGSRTPEQERAYQDYLRRKQQGLL